MLSNKSTGEVKSLALQLASAKLKRNQPAKTTPAATTVTENSGSSTSSGGSGNYGTIGTLLIY